MKTLKTLAKKPLAILLAVVMVVGSISVIAMAEGEPTGNATIATNFKVYNPDTKTFTDGNTVDASASAKKGIEYASAGDIVKIEVMLTTDFEGVSTTILFAFDKDVFDYAWEA